MDNILPAVNQRIKIIIDSKFNGNVTEFSRELGFNSPQKVNRLFKIDNRTQKFPVPSTDMLAKISNLFEISLDELIKGVCVGENVDQGKEESNRYSRNPINAISSKPTTQTEYEPPRNYMEQINKYLGQGENQNEDVKITPVFNHHVTSERVSLVGGNRIPDVLLLNGEFKDCDLVMRHTDPAMNGFMARKSFIGVKQISKESYETMIIPGKAYVIVLQNYVIERFLHPGIEKDLLLKSVDRDMNPDFEITFDQIIELWLIKVWTTMPEAETV